jgi:hypothetical protein
MSRFVHSKQETAHALAKLREQRDSAPAHPLAALRALPVQPIHPLRLFLLERGVSLADAANRHFRCSRRTMLAIVGEWRRPRSARLWATLLGVRTEDLFPGSPTEQ